MSRFTQVFLGLCGLAFVLIGVNTFVDPLRAMSPLELNVNTVNALNELRATYGGLQIGIGLFLFAGVGRATLRRPVLLAQALMVGGLVIGRLVGIALDGLPSGFVQSLLALETTIAVLSVVLYRREPNVR